MARDIDLDLDFLTTKEAAKILRLSPRTLEAMRRNGKGPPFTRMGKDQNAKVVYRRASIREWLADKTHVRVIPRPRSYVAHPQAEWRRAGEDDGWISAFLAQNDRTN